MLSQNKVVKARKAIESMYDGICTVSEYQKVRKPNKSTGFEEVIVLSDQPCRLSFSSINSAGLTDTGVTGVTQAIKLFISPSVEIKAGSKITVKQNNVTTSYKNSGVPAVFSTHQEVMLELFDGWS